MPLLKRVLFLTALLIGAVASYLAGFQTGIFILVVLGMLLEFGFWLGLFRWGKSKPENGR